MSSADIDENGVPRNPDLLVVMDCKDVVPNSFTILQDGID